jgi:hypothetical protein
MSITGKNLTEVIHSYGRNQIAKYIYNCDNSYIKNESMKKQKNVDLFKDLHFL